MKEIPGYPGYFASEDGRIFDAAGVQRKEYISGVPAYKYVNMPDAKAVKNNGWQIKRVHILVATTYHPNPDNLPMVNHIDEDKMNCHESNLEWCTQSHNQRHSLHRRAKTYVTNKLTEQQLKDMVAEFLAGGESKRAVYKRWGTHQVVLDRALALYGNPNPR